MSPLLSIQICTPLTAMIKKECKNFDVVPRISVDGENSNGEVSMEKIRSMHWFRQEVLIVVACKFTSGKLKFRYKHGEEN